NARLSVAEHARMLEETGVRRLIHGGALAERAAELRERLGGELDLLSVGPGDAGVPDLLDLAKDASPVDPRLPTPPDDVVLALFTSGTTGTLKAAQHTQTSYAAIVA